MELKIISHRGNLDGPESCKENSPEAIANAIKYGFDVEIDLWKTNKGLFLGHDEPEYFVHPEYLKIPGLWIHCKTVETADFLWQQSKEINFFFHQTDDCTLTSKGFIWTYPRNGLFLGSRSISVLPELLDRDIPETVLGICTDFPLRYMNDKAHNIRL